MRAQKKIQHPSKKYLGKWFERKKRARFHRKEEEENDDQRMPKGTAEETDALLPDASTTTTTGRDDDNTTLPEEEEETLSMMMKMKKTRRRGPAAFLALSTLTVLALGLSCVAEEYIIKQIPGFDFFWFLACSELVVFSALTLAVQKLGCDPNAVGEEKEENEEEKVARDESAERHVNRGRDIDCTVYESGEVCVQIRELRHRDGAEKRKVNSGDGRLRRVAETEVRADRLRRVLFISRRGVRIRTRRTGKFG